MNKDCGLKMKYEPEIICVAKDKDGKLVAGFSNCYGVNEEPQLEQGEKMPFEISSDFEFGEYETTETHVNLWLDTDPGKLWQEEEEG